MGRNSISNFRVSSEQCLESRRRHISAVGSLRRRWKGGRPVTHTAKQEAHLLASEIDDRAEGKPAQSVKLQGRMEVPRPSKAGPELRCSSASLSRGARAEEGIANQGTLQDPS